MIGSGLLRPFERSVIATDWVRRAADAQAAPDADSYAVIPSISASPTGRASMFSPI